MLMQSGMQTALSRIWSQVADFISYHNYHFPKCASMNVYIIYISNKQLHVMNELLIFSHKKVFYHGLFGLFGFYGISTIIGYLMPNPVHTYILNIYYIIHKHFL